MVASCSIKQYLKHLSCHNYLRLFKISIKCIKEILEIVNKYLGDINTNINSERKNGK